jgi:hypothetical protein
MFIEINEDLFINPDHIDKSALENVSDGYIWKFYTPMGNGKHDILKSKVFPSHECAIFWYKMAITESSVDKKAVFMSEVAEKYQMHCGIKQ